MPDTKPGRGGPRSFWSHGATLALPLLFLPLVVLPPAPAVAQDTNHEWCRERPRDYEHCEVREFSLQTRDGALAVNARPNGGIEVAEWNGSEVRVLARAITRARTDEDARSLAREIEVEAGPGRIATDGPRSSRTSSGWGDREGWSVSYRIQVPMGTDLDLEALNGGIRVEGVAGAVTARTCSSGPPTGASGCRRVERGSGSRAAER